MESHDWDVDKSVLAYKEDMHWENNMVAKEVSEQQPVFFIFMDFFSHLFLFYFRWQSKGERVVEKEASFLF